MSFVALWQPHGNAKGKDVKFACVESELVTLAIPLKKAEWGRWVDTAEVEVYPVAVALEGRYVGQVAFYVKG